MLLSPQAVKYRGTVTGLRISAVDGGETESGGAFIDGANESITALADGNHQIEIYDSAGRMIKGVLKAAGSAEGLGDEKVTNWNFDLGDTGWLKETGWTIVDQGAGNYEAVATNCAVGYSIGRAISANAGELYKLDVICSNFTDGSVSSLYAGTYQGNTITGTGTSTRYANRIVANDKVYAWAQTAGTDLRLGSISCKQVLAPSTSGATIVSAKGGSTWNFAFKDSSFVFNATSYYCIVRKLR